MDKNRLRPVTNLFGQYAPLGNIYKMVIEGGKNARGEFSSS